jgi:hypothetical protein
VVTVGGPAACIQSPPQAFYGGYNLAARNTYRQAARTAQAVDPSVVRTQYPEPAPGAAATTPPALEAAPSPPAANGANASANAEADAKADAKKYVPPPRPIPAGAINYNNGFENISPAAILSPAPEGPTSGHGRRWIRFYFPPGMTYFHDNGAGFANGFGGYGYGYGYGYGHGH